MSLEMTKNLKNTYLSMLSGFLDSNFGIRDALGAIISMYIPHSPITTADLMAVLG